MEGKSFDIRDGGLKDVRPPLPLLEKGEGGDNRSPPYLRKYQELVFLHIQMQLMSEQFNPDFRKRKQDLLS